MKERSRKLIIALITLAATHQLQAVTIFPIATNAVGSLPASSGSNYLVPLIYEDEYGSNYAAFQLVSTNGALIGSMVTLGPGLPLFPQVAFVGTNYLVFWYDSTTGNCYTQPVSTTGAEFGSSLSFGPNCTDQQLLTDGTNLLVAWQSRSNNYYSGQFVTSTGALSGASFQVAPENNYLAGAYGATNYFVIWQNINNEQYPYNMYGAFVSKNGSVGLPFQINQTASLDINSATVGFDGTNFFAVWFTDTARTAGGAPIWNLYARLISQSGTFVSGEILLNTNQASWPSLAFDGAHYLLSWSQNLDTTNSQVIYQFYSRSASPTGPEFTPFPPQGTNTAVVGGSRFDGHRFVTAAVIGSAYGPATNGGLGTFTSASIYGAFLSPLPTLTASNYAGTHFSLTLTGTPGFSYAIQYVANATATNWMSLVTNSPSNGTFNFTDTGATNKSRFYQAVQQ